VKYWYLLSEEHPSHFHAMKGGLAEDVFNQTGASSSLSVVPSSTRKRKAKGFAEAFRL
jgi:hypothetical protein